MDVPQPKKPSEKQPSAKFTKKFYCVKSTSAASRFPYFDLSYLEIPTKVREALKVCTHEIASSGSWPW